MRTLRGHLATQRRIPVLWGLPVLGRHVQELRETLQGDSSLHTPSPHAAPTPTPGSQEGARLWKAGGPPLDLLSSSLHTAGSRTSLARDPAELTAEAVTERRGDRDSKGPHFRGTNRTGGREEAWKLADCGSEGIRRHSTLKVVIHDL